MTVAIVTQELQGAVVGPDAGLAALAEEARRVALPNIARLLPAARAAGYRVVLPRDAVAGFPADYGAAVIANSLSLLATVTTTDDLIATWSAHA